MLTELTDDQAVQKMRLGQSIGFEVLYKRHKSRLRKYIARLLWRLKNSLDRDQVIPNLEFGEWADDISQQTFFNFFRAVESFKGDCSVYTWLCRIAHNQAFNRLRDELKQRGHEISVAALKKLLRLDAEISAELTEDEILSRVSEQIHREIEEDLHYEQLLKKLLDQVQLEKNADYLNECLTALTAVANEVSIEDIAIELKRTPGATRVFLTTCRKKLKELGLKNKLF